MAFVQVDKKEESATTKFVVENFGEQINIVINPAKKSQVTIGIYEQSGKLFLQGKLVGNWKNEMSENEE